MATELTKVRENLSQSLDNLPNLRGSTARWDKSTPCFISIPAHYLWVKLRKYWESVRETSVLNTRLMERWGLIKQV